LSGLKLHSVSWVVLDAGLKLGWPLFAKTLRSVSKVPLVVIGAQACESQVTQVSFAQNMQEIRTLFALPESEPAPILIRETWQQEALINEEVLARALGYKSERIAAVIRQQLEELPTKIHAWGNNQNPADIQREAHAMKGAFGSIGCVRLWKGLEATDCDAKRGNLAEIHRRLPALEEAVAQTITAVQNKMRKG
jgi:HPt (histidine-containing phosphotransfer) domain-containing protein